MHHVHLGTGRKGGDLALSFTRPPCIVASASRQNTPPAPTLTNRSPVRAPRRPKALPRTDRPTAVPTPLSLLSSLSLPPTYLSPSCLHASRMPSRSRRKSSTDLSGSNSSALTKPTGNAPAAARSDALITTSSHPIQ